MRLFVAFAAIVAASPASAMPVSTFLQKANALQSRGPLALLSGDYGLLKQELQGSMLALRNERLTALKNGASPAYCPTQQSGSITVNEVMGAMNAVPTADRGRVEVKDALRIHLAKRFPCNH